MLALLVVAAVLSVVGNHYQNRLIGWVSAVAFFGAVFLYVSWRRDVAARRRARAMVFDRESKTDEDRTRTDE
jgi:hypothetical protein